MSNDVVVYEPRALTREEQIAHILAEVACGRPITRILEEDEGMPHRRTFWQWHMTDDRLRSDLVRAREAGLEVHAEEIIQIADTPIQAEELMEEIGPDGVKRRRTVKEALGHRRLQIETRIKRMQMLAPRTYGPAIGRPGDPVVNPADRLELDEVQRATRLAAIMQSIERRLTDARE